jgi:hypothetical protein
MTVVFGRRLVARRWRANDADRVSRVHMILSAFRRIGGR